MYFLLWSSILLSIPTRMSLFDRIELLDKPWPQTGACLPFYHPRNSAGYIRAYVGLVTFPLLVDIHRLLPCRALALSATEEAKFSGARLPELQAARVTV